MAFLNSAPKTPAQSRKSMHRPAPDRSIVGEAAAVMPACCDYERFGPPVIFRTALFGIFHDRERAHISNVVVPRQRGINLWYVGYELNQQDLDVLLAVFFLFRGREPNSKVHVTQNRLLDLCGLDRCGKDIGYMHERINRLISGVVDITTENQRSWRGSLIASRDWDQITGDLIFTLHKQVVNLFPNGSYTPLNFAVRNGLGKDLLAQWLHAYYVGHINPLSVYVETIHTLCGALGDPSCRFFRRKVRVALDHISTATQAAEQDRPTGLTFDANIKKEKTGSWKINVVTNITPSKLKFAEKRGIYLRTKLPRAKAAGEDIGNLLPANSECEEAEDDEVF